MITWYLLLIVTNGSVKPTVYPTEQDAWIAYTAVKASGQASIFKVSGRRDSPEISEGDCKPVQQFVTPK